MNEPLWREMLAGLVCFFLGHKLELQVVHSVLPAGGHEQERVRCVRRGCLLWDTFKEKDE